jgi:curved DNA-binding protein CbpA
MKALEKAATSTSDGPANIDFTEYYEALGLDPDDEPTLAQINRAYRKAALKSHPDKGGDIAEVRNDHFK